MYLQKLTQLAQNTLYHIYFVVEQYFDLFKDCDSLRAA